VACGAKQGKMRLSSKLQCPSTTRSLKLKQRGKPRNLSDLKNRSENSAGRGQILPVLQVNSRSIDQENGEI
jgi:hypothetical protein